MATRAYRGTSPVPVEALRRIAEGGAGSAAAVEEVTRFLEKLREVQQAVASGTLSVGTTTDGGTAPAPTPGPPGPPGPPGTPYVPDLTPPPTPSGVVVSAGLDFVFITTDAPTFTEGNGYNRTLVYGAQYGGTGPLPTFSSAVLVHEFVGQVGSFATPPGAQWHIWVKWRTNDAVLSVSPSGGANGHQATTALLGNVHLGPLIVEAGNLANGAVTATKLAAEAVGLTAFANGLRPVRVLAALPALPAAGYSDGDTAVLTTDGKLYRIVSSAWTRAVDGLDLIASSVTTGSIAAGAVTATQVAANAITARHVTLTDWTNLVGNHSGEVNGSVSADGWSGLTAGRATSVFSSASEFYLYQTGRDAFYGPWFRVQSGEEFFCSMTTVPQGGGAGDVQINLGLNFRTTAPDTSSGETWISGATRSPAEGGVLTHTGTLVVPGGYQWARVWNQQDHGSSSLGWFYKNLQVRRRNAASLIVDGAITANKLAANAIAVGTAAIQNGAIVNAMIGDATITDAKIVNLSVSKLLAGSLQVGEYIQSSAFVPGSGVGFRIDGGGGAEFRFSGGTRVFHLGASGTDPILRAPGLDILANGSATFSGVLSAATGSFSGSINASVITGGTMTGSVIQTAASGERFVVNEGGSNEAWFYGDRGDGTIEQLASIGLSPFGSDFAIGSFGTYTSNRIAVWARNTGTSAAIYAQTSSGTGVLGAASALGGNGVFGFSARGIGVGGEGGGAEPGVLGYTTGPASSGPGVHGWSSNGYGGRFAGNSLKSALFLDTVNNTAMPTSAAPGALAMVRFPAIGGGGGNVRLCYVDQFGTWRYVSDDNAI